MLKRDQEIYPSVLLRPLGALLLLASFASCTGSPAPDSSKTTGTLTTTSSNVAGASPEAIAQVNSELKVVADSLNSSPTYALSNDDLQLLKESGLLASGDDATLSSFVQH